MFPKAYRWIAEMEEIASFAEGVQGGSGMYQGAADLYRQIADAVVTDDNASGNLAVLREFCSAQMPVSTRKQA
jgi:hypothetical protein